MEFNLDTVPDTDENGHTIYFLPEGAWKGMNLYTYNVVMAAVTICFLDEINLEFLDDIIAIDIPQRKIIIRTGIPVESALLQAFYILIIFIKQGIDPVSLHRRLIDHPFMKAKQTNLIHNPKFVK